MNTTERIGGPLLRPEVRKGSTLLIVEDSTSLRRAMCSIAEGMGLFERVIDAADGLEGYRKLRQEEVDIVLCDLQMPRCDGLGFLRLQQRDPQTARLPVVVLTASDDWQTKVKALDAGACDYVSKPANPEEMRARLAVHLKLKHLYDDLQRKSAELERLTRTDALTGVANRRWLDSVLDAEYARSLRYRRPVGLVMIDLDHFKRLNDEHGHAAGDQALRAVGKLLSSRLRSHDTVARYGGEEFALVLPETTGRHALKVAERIRVAIAELKVEVDGQVLPISASLGVAALPSSSVSCASELIAAADTALYSAKSSGRNRVAGAAGLRGHSADWLLPALTQTGQDASA